MLSCMIQYTDQMLKTTPRRHLEDTWRMPGGRLKRRLAEAWRVGERDLEGASQKSGGALAEAWQRPRGPLVESDTTRTLIRMNPPLLHYDESSPQGFLEDSKRMHKCLCFCNLHRGRLEES